MLGKWDRWYAGLSEPTAYGSTVTYEMGAKFLDGLDVEDWGCGKGWMRTLIPPDRYRGIDGSHSPFADQIVDLAEYRSETPGLFMRHVLEHNYGWRRILENAVASFTERMCLVIFTPFGDVTREIAFADDLGVPDISFRLPDLLTAMLHDSKISWTSEDVESATQYGSEAVFYLTKEMRR